jgi:hypothetical protein
MNIVSWILLIIIFSYPVYMLIMSIIFVVECAIIILLKLAERMIILYKQKHKDKK